MTMFHGLGMFIFGIFAIFVGALVTYYVINKYVDNDKNNNT